jgi:hypothetical protein
MEGLNRTKDNPDYDEYENWQKLIPINIIKFSNKDKK